MERSMDRKSVLIVAAPHIVWIGALLLFLAYY
jgi:hypothetical protein